MMESVQIKPYISGGTGIDIICECGRNALRNYETNEISTNHRVKIGRREDLILVCDCGRQFKVVSQEDHFHIFSMNRDWVNLPSVREWLAGGPNHE